MDAGLRWSREPPAPNRFARQFVGGKNSVRVVRRVIPDDEIETTVRSAVWYPSYTPIVAQR